MNGSFGRMGTGERGHRSTVRHHVAVGLPAADGVGGDPGPHTSLGVFLGLKAAVRHALGKDEIAAARKELGLEAEDFAVPADILSAWRELGARGSRDRAGPSWGAAGGPTRAGSATSRSSTRSPWRDSSAP